MATMSETIQVQGRECYFVDTKIYGVRITNGHHVLASDGRWHHWGKQDATYWPTEAAAREFARQHADKPAEPGPQRQPATVRQIEAQTKQANRELAQQTELAELRAEVERLRAQLAAERAKRAELVRRWWVSSGSHVWRQACLRCASELAALDQPAD